jgi:sensor histidine kinase YesM
VAVQGGVVVNQVVDTMKGINDSQPQDCRHHQRD